MLERKPRLAGRFGHRRDATMIFEPSAIEADLFDSSLKRPLGNGLAHNAGGRNVTAVRRAAFARTGGHQCLAALVVNHLGVHMFVTAKHAQARPLGVAEKSLANAELSPLSQSVDSSLVIHLTAVRLSSPDRGRGYPEAHAPDSLW